MNGPDGDTATPPSGLASVTGASARPRLRPERRTRTDLVVVALIAVAVLGGALLVALTSAVAATTDSPAALPVAAPPHATALPANVTEAWRAPSGATDAPVITASAVVTGDGSTVTGHDAVTGQAAWSYHRDVPLCTVAAGFPDAAGGGGRVLALFRNGDGAWCSELTSLHPALGTRAETSNPDMRPGTHLLATSPYVAATGERYLEVWRSDLVRTLEYGALPTPVQVGKQPRPDCSLVSTALAADRVGVIERCPDAATDRLSVLSADGPDGADAPQTRYSVELPPGSGGATLVALTADRAAVAIGDQLVLLDESGSQLESLRVAAPVALPATTPGAPAVTTSDARFVYWWTGSAVVALNASDLTPFWTATGALGPPVPYAGGLLVPVLGGLRELDPETGRAGRTLRVDRDDPAAPVRLAAAGEMLLEQRGSELVALRPS